MSFRPSCPIGDGDGRIEKNLPSARSISAESDLQGVFASVAGTASLPKQAHDAEICVVDDFPL